MIEHSHTVSMSESTQHGTVKAHSELCAIDAVLVAFHFWQLVAEQVQEEQEHSRALAAKHDSVLQQLSTENAHTAELDAQIESQHKVCLCTTCSCLYVQLSQASIFLQSAPNYQHNIFSCTTCSTSAQELLHAAYLRDNAPASLFTIIRSMLSL